MSQLSSFNPVVKIQRGISLIESLVAIVVMALGILGILGVQMRTLSDTSTSVRRAQAIRLIEDLGERMKTNPSALANLNSYVSNFAAIPTVGSCIAGCDQAQLAAYDLAVWKRGVRENLPLGKASIFLPPAESALPAGQARQLGVMIAWRENERDTSTGAGGYKDDIDATKVRAADGTLSAGGGADANFNSCPPNTRATCNIFLSPRDARHTRQVLGCLSTTVQGLEMIHTRTARRLCPAHLSSKNVFVLKPTLLGQAQGGVTLIELLVGIAIGLLTVAVAMGALMVSRGCLAP